MIKGVECFVERSKEHGRWINNFFEGMARGTNEYEDVRKRKTIINKHHNGFVMQRRKRTIELQPNTTQIFTKFRFVKRDKRLTDSSDKREGRKSEHRMDTRKKGDGIIA